MKYYKAEYPTFILNSSMGSVSNCILWTPFLHYALRIRLPSAWMFVEQ